MVGVPRSTGCGTCVKRRIKCDEGKPQCENCLKYGSPCPGYDRELKFITGKPHRTKRSSKPNKSKSPHSDAQTRFTPESLIKWSNDITALEPFDEKLSREKCHRPFLDLIYSLCATLPPQKQYQLQLISSLCENLPTTRSSEEIQMISGYLMHLPAHFGNSRALDAAAVAFAAQQIGTICGDKQMIGRGRDAYVRALSCLQRALNDPAEATRSETNSSALLLCIYELFAGTTAFNVWMKHAAGLSKLIQHRGADSFRNDHDIAILRACRGVIIMDCMFSGKEVFFNQNTWREVTRAQKPAHMDDDFHQFFERFMELMAELAELLADGWNLREATRLGQPLPIDVEKIHKLVCRTTQVYTRLKLWSLEMEERLSSPIEESSSTNDALFPIVYAFRTYTAAGLYVNYWACMIILRMILQTCGCVPEDAVDNREFANKICRSVEWNSRDVWAGFRLGFPLRIAFEAADPNVQRWIGEKHVMLSKTYAASSLEGLPEYGIIKHLKDQLASSP
ncbi:hypothetical protein, variant 2 [Verruconis gallopava]|uniref:Zn(2)-C6 fungal-type domain-containing protein n=1 Tax=Verruconis gallopava TaxID=253628 RepID=A0A0D2A886_9PEZI|nr:hypothetical protein, variant 2 [Verruconis gallopava]KIW02968.1 hypothetical protein, variant 2 [Verruconis gallopava]